MNLSIKKLLNAAEIKMLCEKWNMKFYAQIKSKKVHENSKDNDYEVKFLCNWNSFMWK
jgi:hypothetical protein